MSFSVEHEFVVDLETVVRAITAAFEEADQRRIEEDLETNNWMLLGRSDYINSKLRQIAIVDGVELIPFARYVWQGRILLDRRHKASIIIMTESTLKDLVRRDRSRPHYAETLQHILNADLPAKYEQTSLFSDDRFDEQTYIDDFKTIVKELFDPKEGYRNYFITYSTERSRVINVSLKVFNSEFQLVEEVSLNEFLKPNFAALTSPVETVGPQNEDEHVEATRNLSKLKVGIKPVLHEEEHRA